MLEVIDFLDSQLAAPYFQVFTRIEYSLKRSGYSRIAKNGTIEADWDKFSKITSKDFKEDNFPKYLAAKEYLLNEPPRRQIKTDEGEVDFERVAAPLAGNNDFEKLISATKRVRNNLYHGGKMSFKGDWRRNEILLEHCHEVLEAAVMSNEPVLRAYMGG